jgi:hypothetical protein
VPDIDAETTEELKLINDINLKSLADSFAKAIGQHVGGTFEVTLKKFEQTSSGFLNRFEIVMIVEDESTLDRCRQHSHGGFFGDGK